MLRSQMRASADLVLDGLARADLAVGRLCATLHNAAAPLGTGPAVVAVTEKPSLPAREKA
jgi:hypothetical protein